MGGRQPPDHLLGPHRQVTGRRRGPARPPLAGLPRLSLSLVVVLVVAALVVAACTSGGTESPDPEGTVTGSAGASSSPSESATQPTSGATSGSASGSTSGSAPPTASTAAVAARVPQVGQCYLLGFQAAAAPTNSADPVRCSTRHTAVTYFVGTLETVVDGHLLAVDSERAQRQVSEACPRELRRYVDGSPRDLRLARLQAVWFSPTLEQADQGASWFRCDVVALAGRETLADLPPRLDGVLARPDGLARFGLCGTTAPGASGFERVICSRPHAWRAVTTIDIGGDAAYPGVSQVRRAGEGACRDLVRRRSGSPEEFEYGWEWPTRAQWKQGQHYGFCWAPD